MFLVGTPFKHQSESIIERDMLEKLYNEDLLKGFVPKYS